MNNISFQGKTVFLNNIPPAQKTFNLIKSSSNKLTGGKVYSLEADAQNIAVIVRNETNGIIKFLPINGDCSKVIDEIATKVEQLIENAKEKLTAWIVGGSSNSKFFGQTIEKVNKVANIVCDKPNIDASILAGSVEGSDRITFHTLSDKIELAMDKTFDTKRPIIEQLEQHFKIVELNNVNT